MVREEARRTLLREYDKWAKDHPDDVTKRSGVVFFTYLQKERLDLLDFHAVGGDKWATIHGWLYYTGRVKDRRNVLTFLCQTTAAGSGGLSQFVSMACETNYG